MNPYETPDYIKSLTVPSAKKPTNRRVWGIDLETVWLPFFTASNTQGDTAIPYDALGCPLRLAYAVDGSVKFSKTGRPVIRVVKVLGDNIRLAREHFTSVLLDHVDKVRTSNEEGFNKQVKMCLKAGKPIAQRDTANLEKAIAIAMAEAIEKAEAEAKAEAEPKAGAEAVSTGTGKDKVLAHA
ncbi:hypothetical protein ES705_28461 [subsurface metagenome]